MPVTWWRVRTLRWLQRPVYGTEAPAVWRGWELDLMAEQPAEKARVFVTDFGGYGVYRCVTCFEHVPGFPDAHAMHALECCHTSGLAEATPEHRAGCREIR